jgi:hypothetical protein
VVSTNKDNLNISKYFNRRHFFSLFCLIGLGVVFYYTWDYFPFCDEFENLYDTFLLSNGLLPHKDYWRTKLPGLHLMFAPLFTILSLLLSKHQLYFSFRFIILLLQCFSQIYFLKQMLALTGTDIENKYKSQSKLPFYAVVTLMSYVVSPQLMTNLFWSESFQYCYLLVASGFFIKFSNGEISYRDCIFLGLISAGSILVSLIAIPIVMCILFFVGISMFMGISGLTRQRINRYLCLLGVICLPLILFLFFVIFKIGWQDFYYQIWIINHKYNAITAFDCEGIFGVILKPIEFVWGCLGKSNFSLSLTADRRVPLTSFIYILLFSIIINYLFLKTKTNYKLWLLVAFWGVLIYVSLIRGIAFHVGFVFHFLSTLSVVWLILLYKQRIVGSIPLFLKCLLAIPIGIYVYIIIHCCITLNLHVDFKTSPKYSEKIADNCFWASEVDKLLASVNDLNSQQYRVWIPTFLPKPLYYAGLLPADKTYMLIPHFLDDPYLNASYDKVLADENVLVLPGICQEIHDDLRIKLAEKLDMQSIYIPSSICDFDVLADYIDQNQDGRYKYITMRRLNIPIGSGIRIVGIANRGYRYSFFLDSNDVSPRDAKFVISLENKDGDQCYKKSIFIKEKKSGDAAAQMGSARRLGRKIPMEVQLEGSMFRIDWEIFFLSPNIRRKGCDMKIEIFLPGTRQVCSWRCPFLN